MEWLWVIIVSIILIINLVISFLVWWERGLKIGESRLKFRFKIKGVNKLIDFYLADTKVSKQLRSSISIALSMVVAYRIFSLSDNRYIKLLFGVYDMMLILGVLFYTINKLIKSDTFSYLMACNLIIGLLLIGLLFPTVSLAQDANNMVAFFVFYAICLLIFIICITIVIRNPRELLTLVVLSILYIFSILSFSYIFGAIYLHLDGITENMKIPEICKASLRYFYSFPGEDILKKTNVVLLQFYTGKVLDGLVFASIINSLRGKPRVEDKKGANN